MVIYPDATPQPFVASRPEWTVNGALLKTAREDAARVIQSPFYWKEGAWEADVTIFPVEAAEGMSTVTLKVRVTPDTLRRWKDVGINPFLEACAQLQEYWRRARPADADTLTWL